MLAQPTRSRPLERIVRGPLFLGLDSHITAALPVRCKSNYCAGGFATRGSNPTLLGVATADDDARFVALNIIWHGQDFRVD